MKTKDVYLVYQMKVFEKTEGSVNLNKIRDVRKEYSNSKPILKEILKGLL